MNVLLANPRGFCAGVDRAIEVVERVLKVFPPPVYVRHEVVHNKFVVDSLKRKGAIFVEEIEEVPSGAIVIFSAHGVAQNVRDVATKHDIKVFDATCPLVTKVHIEVIRNSREGIDTILIGHRGHPEVAGTMGQYGSYNKGQIYLVESVEDATTIEVMQPDRLAYVTQTTLSVDDTQDIVDELMRRFPSIRAPRKDDICYATQNRQNAVKELVKQCDLILIIGSKSSSNSNRLREIPLKHGIEAYLIDSADEINVQWLDGKQCVGVSAGASAPELLVKEVVAMLKKYGVEKVDEMQSEKETVSFPLPSELKTITLN